MTPEQEVRRAERARQILEDELFKDAVREIEQALLAGIHKSAFKDAELREKLCQRYALLHDLLGALRTHIETGRLAKAQLEEKAWVARMRERVGL